MSLLTKKPLSALLADAETTLTLHKGKGQAANDGTAVPQPLAVRVVDVSNEPVAGIRVTLDFLGEDTTSAEQAEQTVRAYESVLAGLASTASADTTEVSVKLSAIGQALPGDGERIALDGARRICQAAEKVGEVAQTARDSAGRQKSTVAAAIDAGKKAYQEEKRKTEMSGRIEAAPKYTDQSN